MNQEKITTYHLIDLLIMVLAGIGLMALSAVCSPKQLFPLCLGVMTTGLMCFAFAMSIGLLFVTLQSSGFGDGLKTFFGLLYELLIEVRIENKVEAHKKVIERHIAAEMPKDNYPW